MAEGSRPGAGRNQLLRQTQEALMAMITGAQAVAVGDPPSAEALVNGDERLDAGGRVAIYAHMYFTRLLDVLREDYPRLARFLGEQAFQDLVARFLRWASPPTALRHLGAGLPGFLERSARGEASGWGPGPPWLADLARLEWARADLFDRPDAEPLELATVQALAASQSQLGALTLQTVPAFQLCPVGFAVEEPWRNLDRGEPAGAPAPTAGLLLVWRRGREILHRRALGAEAPLLPLLEQGTTLPALAERLGRGRSIEEAARLSFELVAGWLVAGLIRRPPLGEVS